MEESVPNEHGFLLTELKCIFFSSGNVMCPALKLLWLKKAGEMRLNFDPPQSPLNMLKLGSETQRPPTA